MGQKYPSHKRFRSSLPKCCRSRVGAVKARFPSEAEAAKVAKKHAGEFEIYPCSGGNGFHLMKKRDND